MKKLTVLFLFCLGLSFSSEAQIKTLSYNTANGHIIADTNVVWTNAFNVSSNQVAAQIRTNIGLGITNVPTFSSVRITNIQYGDLLEIGPTKITAPQYNNARIDFETKSLESDNYGQWVIRGPLLIQGLYDTNIGDYDPSPVIETRQNLGLGAAWLTNVFASEFVEDIGLGPQTNVSFDEVRVGLYDTQAYETVFASSKIALRDLNEGVNRSIISFTVGLGSNFHYVTGIVAHVPISFSSNSFAATTRTNLGLGATWLTTSNSPLFWTNPPATTNSSGTAGQVAYTNNYLYICVGSNSWRRIQLGTW